ncbi:hypothetical protein PPSIR1_26333 [Plesiocystis pacifica SIR-1]|uniref:Uncharacterized protein n=1 Tax=Plesiocystis pacifica SIR-1 TaxID=391625 RepID=A6G9X7_9BACT|nr:hypothetical protein [Plesiocystis pacifica]EDM77302.1 hypothetical protein PPSIR1_26333 [Plesiocystis pacifica SIR-1]
MNAVLLRTLVLAALQLPSADAADAPAVEAPAGAGVFLPARPELERVFMPAQTAAKARMDEAFMSVRETHGAAELMPSQERGGVDWLPARTEGTDASPFMPAS